MNRTVIRSVVAAAVCTLAVAPLMTGCKASASAQVGGGTPNPPPPPPPPPPPASAPTPAPTPAATPAPPPQKLKGDVKGSRVNIPGNIVYETGKAKIKPESEPTLMQLKQFMDDNPQVTLLRIEGHTDSDGDPAMNMKLSGERAKAVVDWLVAHGESRDRFLAVGFGQTKPIAPNDTPANKEQNRRTEFHIAQLEGKNYLGRDPTGGGTVFK